MKSPISDPLLPCTHLYAFHCVWKGEQEKMASSRIINSSYHGYYQVNFSLHFIKLLSRIRIFIHTISYSWRTQFVGKQIALLISYKGYIYITANRLLQKQIWIKVIDFLDTRRPYTLLIDLPFLSHCARTLWNPPKSFVVLSLKIA